MRLGSGAFLELFAPRRQLTSGERSSDLFVDRPSCWVGASTLVKHVVDRANLESSPLGQRARPDLPEGNGYGVAVASGANNWRNTGRGRRAKGSILLLKLHGSLNWRAGGPPLRLRADPYQTVEQGVIAPPLTNKPVQDEPFREIWKRARVAVGRMRRLLIIGACAAGVQSCNAFGTGYGVCTGDITPVATHLGDYAQARAYFHDGLVRTLLATDLSPHLEDVVIVDPSEATQANHVGLFTRVAPQARVISLKTFRQLAALF